MKKLLIIGGMMVMLTVSANAQTNNVKNVPVKPASAPVAPASPEAPAFDVSTANVALKPAIPAKTKTVAVTKKARTKHSLPPLIGVDQDKDFGESMNAIFLRDNDKAGESQVRDTVVTIFPDVH